MQGAFCSDLLGDELIATRWKTLGEAEKLKNFYEIQDDDEGGVRYSIMDKRNADSSR